MPFTIKVTLIVSLFLAPWLTSSAAIITIERDRDNIFNHGDSSVEGTIAHAFKTHGKNNTYVLTTPATGGSYGIYNKLLLPEGSTLKSSSNGQSWLRAYAAINRLIGVGSNSMINDVILDGNYLVKHVIQGTTGLTNFTLSNSTVKKSRNNNGTVETKSHLVVISGAEDIKIYNNIITQAGDSGHNLGSVNTEASGLYLTNNHNVQVMGNHISYVLSAGVNTTNSVDVKIINNIIDNTGRSNLYSLGYGRYASDGITAYHNGLRSPYQYLYYEVSGNRITNWYNHGIHLSGAYLKIMNNLVYAPGLKNTTGHAIFVGDANVRDKTACSRTIWIQNNHVKRSKINPASDGIRMAYYHWDRYWRSQNVGDVITHLDITDHRNRNLGSQTSCTGRFY